MPYDNESAHVLITSRNQIWKKIKPLKLSGFTHIEACQYIGSCLAEETKESKLSLYNALSGFPLALSQAVAYISETGNSIKSYLKLYQDSAKQLLNTSGFDEDIYLETVYTTWQVAVGKLSANKHTLDALRFCAYLSGGMIPYRLLKEWLKVEDFELNAVIKSLRTYSLIDVDSGLPQQFRVHRLVQKVMRLQFEEKETLKKESSLSASKLTITYLARLLFFMDEQFSKNVEYEPKKWPYLDAVLPHASLFYIRLSESYKRVLLPRLAFSLGKYCRFRFNHTQALALYEIACEQSSVLYKTDKNPDMAASLNGIGMVHDRLGEHNLALQYYNRSLVILKKFYGKSHPKVAIALNNVGAAHKDLGQNEKALGCYKQSLAIYESPHAEPNSSMDAVLNNIGVVCAILGDSQQALIYLKKSLSVKEKLYDKSHPKVAGSLNNIGKACKDSGQVEEALDYYKQSLTIYEKSYGELHPETVRTLSNIAELHESLCETKKALTYLKRLLNIFKHFKSHVQIQQMTKKINLLLSEPSQAQSVLKQPKVQFKHSFLEANPLSGVLKRYQIDKEGQLPTKAKALRRASALGKEKDVIFLLKVTSIDARDDNPKSKKTALHQAVINNRPDVVNILLQQEADTSIKDALGKTAKDYIAKEDKALLLLFNEVQPKKEKSTLFPKLFLNKTKQSNNIQLLYGDIGKSRLVFKQLITRSVDKKQRKGSCGFNALGTTRDVFEKLLMSNLQSLTSEQRTLIGKEMLNGLLSDELVLKEEAKEQLKRCYQDFGKLQSKFNQLLSRYSSSGELKTLKVDELINHYKHSNDDIAKELINSRLQMTQAEYILETHCSSQTVIKDYLKQNISTEWLGMNVARVWAQLSGIYLRIWQSDETQGRLCCSNTSDKINNPTETIDVYHSGDHFDRLKIITSDEIKNSNEAVKIKLKKPINEEDNNIIKTMKKM